jgi:hypothetical protein
MISKLLAVAAVIVALAVPAPANAMTCGPRTTVVKKLANHYKEKQAAIGLAADGRLIEVWVNPKSRGFTVMLTTPLMVSCIVATGKAMEIDEPTELVAGSSLSH